MVFKMKHEDKLVISQIAIRVPDQLSVQSNIQNIFGFSEFFNDKLKMDGSFLGEILEDVDLNLSFNYQVVPNFELEFITTPCEDHWHNEIIEKSGEVFLSHLGVYCGLEFLRATTEVLESKDIKILQHSVSYDHSNKRSDGSVRSYEDVIFDTEDMLGFRLKLSAHSEKDTK